MKTKYVFIGLIAILVLGLTGCAQQVAKEAPAGITTKDNFTATNITATGDVTVTDDLTVGDDVSISGDTVMSNDLEVDEITALGTLDLSTNRSGIIYGAEPITATTTLTSAYGNYILFPASANQITVTLPASTTDGAVYEFVVTGALTGASVTIASAEGDNISGILMVNDADVVCDAEDFINIITDGEVIGDRVKLLSTGSGWIILDSDWDAAGKLTCTDPS